MPAGRTPAKRPLSAWSHGNRSVRPGSVDDHGGRGRDPDPDPDQDQDHESKGGAGVSTGDAYVRQNRDMHATGKAHAAERLMHPRQDFEYDYDQDMNAEH